MAKSSKKPLSHSKATPEDIRNEMKSIADQLEAINLQLTNVIGMAAANQDPHVKQVATRIRAHVQALSDASHQISNKPIAP